MQLLRGQLSNIKLEQEMLITATQKSQASPELMGLAIRKEAVVQEAMQDHLGVVGTSAQNQQEKREMVMK